METMTPILAAHPFFKGLDSRYLKLIAGVRLPGDLHPGAISLPG